jgi:hypothetical protein
MGLEAEAQFSDDNDGKPPFLIAARRRCGNHKNVEPVLVSAQVDQPQGTKLNRALTRSITATGMVEYESTSRSTFSSPGVDGASSILSKVWCTSAYGEFTSGSS